MKEKDIIKHFQHLYKLILTSRKDALLSVNKSQLNLYWQIGTYINKKIEARSWGDKVVEQLEKWLSEQEPGIKGFDRRNIYRMREFFLAWNNVSWSLSPSGLKIVGSTSPQMQTTEDQIDKIVVTVSPRLPQIPDWLTKIPWSHHLALLSATKNIEERVFYILLTEKENYTIRELRRQLKSGLYERQKMSSRFVQPLKHPKAELAPQIFRDKYIFEFLDLPEPYIESDLKKALIAKLKHFILELGKDFIFIDEEFRLKVGLKDYYIDLLFYHRELQCLVVYELKTVEFEPEHLGKINFYLEALDRDVKKPHENPSIGVLLCKTKDNTVVEYALSRNISPALVSEYQTKLIDKGVLQKMLNEWSENIELNEDES